MMCARVCVCVCVCDSKQNRQKTDKERERTQDRTQQRGTLGEKNFLACIDGLGETLKLDWENEGDRAFSAGVLCLTEDCVFTAKADLFVVLSGRKLCNNGWCALARSISEHLACTVQNVWIPKYSPLWLTYISIFVVDWERIRRFGVSMDLGG